MGGSAEFRARRKISAASVNGMKPVETETFSYKNTEATLDYSFDYEPGEESTWEEPGYGSSIEVSTKNRGEVYREVDIDWYVVNGDYYGKFTLDGKEYVMHDDKIDDFIRKKLGKNFEPVDSVDDDIISTVQGDNPYWGVIENEDWSVR
ncbi:MAG: hypothetical protein J6W04_04275 [Bacteroidales bacterium]|nr:hypothetical protein [Bacteroidales bacterium]